MTNTTDSDRIERLRQFLGQDPDNKRLLLDLCDLLIDADRAIEARPLVESALAKEPSEPQFRYRLAVIAQREGHFEEARRWLRELVAEGVTAPPVLLAWGQLQLDMGQAEGAALTLEPLCHAQESLGLRPMAVFLRMRSLHHLGQLDAAIELAEAGLQDDFPVKLRDAILTGLATLYLDAQRHGDAHRVLEMARQQGISNAELSSVGGFLLLHQADPKSAQQQFEASLSSAPDLGRAHLGLGLSHAAVGRLAQACEALELATQHMPTHLGTWHALAWMRLLRKDLIGANEAFEQALKMNSSFGETYGGLALVAVLQGERARAQILLRTGRKLDPLSLNIGTAEALMSQGGDMSDPDFFDRTLQMLHERLLSKDTHMQSTFYKLMGRDPGQKLH